jgi:hypothetical protein
MSRDRVYFLAPKRGGGWTVRTVVEHGRYHDARPSTWRGPYASAYDARREAETLTFTMAHTPTRHVINEDDEQRPEPQAAAKGLQALLKRDDAGDALDGDVLTTDEYEAVRLAVLLLSAEPQRPTYAELLSLANMVALGNTDADDLAKAASRLLGRGPICEVDMDSATYIGSEDDGVYVAVAEGQDGGWYTSSTVDCNTSHFTDTLVQDQGPYPTREKALAAGINGAKDWCITNNVQWEESK